MGNKKIYALFHCLSLFAMGFAHDMHRTNPHRSGPQFCLDYEHTTDSACDLNTPGTEGTIFFVPIADFLAEQEPPAAPATIDLQGIIATVHTFAATKGFFGVGVTLDKNSVQHEFQGEAGSGNWKNSCKFFVKGNRNEVRGLVQQWVRDNTVFIIPLKDGTRAQIGSSKHKCEIKGNFDSKTDKAQDARGWEITVEAFAPWPTYYAAGLAITLNTV